MHLEIFPRKIGPDSMTNNIPTPDAAPKSLLFLGQNKYSGNENPVNEGDKPYLPYLKPIMGGVRTFVDLTPVSTFYEIESYCNDKRRNITGVVSTSISLLARLTGKTNPTLDNYAGSYFKRNGIEYVFVPTLDQVVSVPYGKFLLERYVSKLTRPQDWTQQTNFDWKIIEGYNTLGCAQALNYLNGCSLLAVDIETFSSPLAIRCIGYTGAKMVKGIYESFSFVLPVNSMAAVHWMRKFNETPAAKILQNGKYDSSYLAHYNAPLHNYLWDTANLFHSWYSELPKDLAFLQAFFVREASYWKDMAESSDLETYYLYNAKDTWATLNVFLAWILQAPDWARTNYELEFPLVFPCHLGEMTGIARDMSRMQSGRKAIDLMVDRKVASLNRTLGVENFNVNSPKQMRQLLDVLGCKSIQSGDEKSLAKAAYQHPLNARIIDLVRGVPKTDNIELMGIRSLRKAKSTYLRVDDDITATSKGGGSEYKGRILYAMNPHGTDTGRLASKRHHFWCGLQIQNIPGGETVKSTLIADPDFYFGEVDLEQAETRDTAYITGDIALINAVNSERDFHSINVEAFFGIPYDQVYDDKTKKTLNKPIRNVGKRVNHGANYNMGPDVLVDTMGEKQIYEAARLLKLPLGWTAREIAQHFLAGFDRKYPVIRGEYHRWVIEQILVHKKLVGALGWTRYCFNNPSKSKPALNAYIAHSPQSLNAQVLNKAYMKVFYELALHPEHRQNFKLCAQVHDSILFQFRRGHEYLAEEVRKRMEIPVVIRDIKGIERTFTVPAAIKIGKPGTWAKYWSEIE